MTQTLAEFLREASADAPTVQSAVRHLVADLTDFATPEDLHKSVVAAAGDEPALVDTAIADLAADPEALYRTDMAVLQVFWDDEQTRERVREAVSGATERLPAAEWAIAALTAVAALALLVTGGRTKATERTVRRADGSYEKTQEVEYQNIAAILSSLGAVITKMVNAANAVQPPPSDPNADAAPAAIDPATQPPQPGVSQGNAP
jgi:hypothetical protein